MNYGRKRKNVLYPGLAAEMARNGDTYASLGNAVNLSEYTIWRRMCGKVEWNIGEINAICAHYQKDYKDLFC